MPSFTARTLDRDVVESDGHEDLALAVGQLVDLPRQRVKLLLLLDRLVGSACQGIWQLRPREILHAGRLSAPTRPRTVAETLKKTNLYAQVANRLSPRKTSILSRTFTSASSAACCARSSNSGPATDHSGGVGATIGQGDPPQHSAQAHNRLSVARVPNPKLLDPSSRVSVKPGRRRAARASASRSVRPLPRSDRGFWSRSQALGTWYLRRAASSAMPASIFAAHGGLDPRVPASCNATAAGAAGAKSRPALLDPPEPPTRNAITHVAMNMATITNPRKATSMFSNEFQKDPDRPSSEPMNLPTSSSRSPARRSPTDP